MLTLLQQYARIALLMTKPQELPAGTDQLKIGIFLSLVTYVLAVASIDGVAMALYRAVIEIGLTAALFWLGLSVVNRTARFAQAFGGLCGASAMLQIVAIPILLSRGAAELSSVGVFAQFFLLVWSLSLLGYVFRHTFETSVPTSIGVAFLFYLVLIAVLETLTPSVDAQAALLLSTGVWVV